MTFPKLTDRDRRTLKFASIGLVVYLALFVGWRGFSTLNQRREAYVRLQREATDLRVKLELYESRAIRLQRLMEAHQMDPSKLNRTTLVAQASAALQQSAMQGGVQLGPIRETLARAAERELGTIQLEANGQVPALLGFLHRLRGLGFPLVIDGLQFTSEPTRPGMIKLRLGLILLNFEQWAELEVPRG